MPESIGGAGDLGWVAVKAVLLQGGELARAGLTAEDVYALLRENGVGDLGQVGYLLYETRGVVTVIGADREPSPLARDGLNASGYH